MTHWQYRRGPLALLAALVLGIVLSLSPARGQESPAAAYEGLIVYDASQEPIAQYFLVQGGLRRAVDLARVDAFVDILGISPDELAAIPEGPPIVLAPVPTPQAAPSRTPTPTPTVTPTPGVIGPAAATTAVVWGTPGPLVAPTPGGAAAGATPGPEGGLVRPPIVSLRVGRMGGSNVAFASAPDGSLFRYRESTGAWENLTAGRLSLPGGSVGGALLVSQSDPPLVIYTTQTRSGTSVTRQVHRSNDGGESWSSSTVEAASGRVLYQLPSRADTIFMGTNDGLLRSDDRGQSWSAVGSLPGPGFVVWAVTSAPQDDSHLAVGGSTLFGTGQVGGRLFESLDGGATWAEVDYASVTRAPVLSLAFDPIENGRLLVGLDGDGGLREGAPLGAQRTPRFRPIGSSNVNRVAALAFRPGVVAGGAPAGSVSNSAGTPVATLTSRSDGTYELPALTPGPYSVLITQPAAGVQLFAGTLPGGVPAISAGVSLPTPTPALATPGAGATAGPASGGTTIGILVNGGIFLSFDRGLSFADASNGIDVRAVGQVAFSPDGKAIFIGGGAPMLGTFPSPGGVFRGETRP